MSTDVPATAREKTLPSNLEAERTVLGAILVDNAAFNSAAEILNREDFYRDAHRRIFEAMGALSERSQPIDLVTLKDELGRRSALEAVGGAPFLAALVDGVPRITSVEHWSRLIKEKAVLRNLIHAGNRIVQECYEGEDEAAELLDRAEKAIFDIAEFIGSCLNSKLMQHPSAQRAESKVGIEHHGAFAEVVGLLRRRVGRAIP